MGELAIPEIGDDDALLRVEACGLCGTDLEQLGGMLNNYPVIPGHEIVGIIDQIGPNAAARWAAKAGDRVAVEPRLVCHRCDSCLRGKLCRRYPLTAFRNFGQIPVSVAPSLWGGYAEYMYLHSDANIHHVPATLAAHYAVLFNPLANGIEWSVTMPQPQFGDTVVVLGAGQRGLASVIALRARGIENIVVTGLTADRHKLELGAKLGAVPVDIQTQDLRDVVREVSSGDMAAVVVDTTPHATQPILDAIDIVRDGGQIVIGGLKGRPVDGLNSDLLIMKDLTIRGGVVATHDSYAKAVAMVSDRFDQVSLLHTHSLQLEEATRALEMLAGRHPHESPIAIALVS